MEKKVLIRGIESNFKIEGEGKPLLILHGWGGSSDSWLDISNKLTLKGYKIICPDLPGFGKSGIPQKSWSLTDYLNWTLDFVNYFNLDKFYLIGHSFGGRIAVKLAANYPQRLEKLILCSPAGIKIKLSLKTGAIRLIAEIGNYFFNLKYLRVFKDIARSIFYFFLRHKDYVKAKGVMRETMKKVLEKDISFCLSKINTKTLIIWGKNDKMVPIKYASIFKEKIKNSKLEVLASVGHNPHLEAPEELAELIIKFFA